MGWGVSHVDLATIRARFLEWAEDEGEIVVEHTFDNGGSEGEMAALKTLPVRRLTGADLDQAYTWLLEGYVRFIENRSAAALTAAIAFENFRSKFNPPLGIEAQGLCMVPQ